MDDKWALLVFSSPPEEGEMTHSLKLLMIMVDTPGDYSRWEEDIK